MKDDRGNRANFSVAAKKMLADSESPLSLRALQLLPGPLRLIVRYLGVFLVLVLLGLGSACIWTMTLNLDVPSDIPEWVGILFVYSIPLFLICGILLPLLLNSPIWFNRRAARELKICIGCVYSLEGLVAEPDGCTVCPECGAAWKLPEQNEHDVQAGDGAHSG